MEQDAKSLDGWLITTGAENCHRYCSEHYHKGWRLFNQPYTLPRKYRGTANADFEISFIAGLLCGMGASYYNELVIGSGDGDLVMSICHCVRQYMPEIKITAITGPQGISQRIKQRMGGIDTHLVLGSPFIVNRKPRNRKF